MRYASCRGFFSSLLGPIAVAGNQTADDPILLQGRYGIGGFSTGLAVLPSVNEIIANSFGAAGSGFAAWETPAVLIAPLGNANLSQNLLLASNGSGNVNLLGGFALPGPNGTTDYYFYFSRGYVEYCVNNTGNSCPEVRNVLGPAYPLGCAVKIPMGVLTSPSRSGGNSQTLTTGAYGVVNASFTDGRGAVMPFTDEYSYLSTGAAGGTDCYCMQPTIEKLNSGAYSVLFSMIGIADDKTNSALKNEMLRVRPFAYSPETETFYEGAVGTNTIFTDTEIGFAGPPTGSQLYDDNSPIFWRSGENLFLWGYIGGQAASALQGVAYFLLYGAISTLGVPLSHIVADLCTDAGLVEGQDFEVSDLASEIVPGFAVARESTIRQALEMLMSAYFFDAIESDGIIKFRFQGKPSVGAIAEGDLATVSKAAPDPPPKLEEVRGQEADLPRSVVVAYQSAALNYQTATQQAQRLHATTSARDRQRIELTMVLDEADAAHIAERILYLAWLRRETFSTTLPPAYIQYDPGDALDVTADGVLHTVHLTKVELGGDNVVSVSGWATAESVFFNSTVVGAAPNIVTIVPGTIEPTTLVLMDLPPLRDQDAGTFGFYYAMAGTDAGWRGATLYQSLDGTNYGPIGAAGLPTPMGQATTALATGTGYDLTNAVTVQLSYSTLSSATAQQTASFTNLCLLGQEVMTFDNATLVSPGVYTLSNLRRGLKGTQLCVEGHQVGDRFVLLDPSTIGRFTDQPINRGVAIHYKAPTSGQSLSAAPDHLFTNNGASDQPEPALTPVSPGVQRFSWGPAFGPPPGTYELQWSIDGGTTWTDTTVSGSTLSHDINPALPNTNYIARVRAISADTLITTDWQTTGVTNSGGFLAGVPAAPTGLAATPGTNQNALAWNANAVTDSVMLYKLYAGHAHLVAFNACSAIFEGAALSYTHTGLGAADEWTYYLVATNAAGDSLPEGPVDATTMAAAAKDWILYGNLAGPPADGQELFNITALGGEGLPQNLAGSEGGCEVAPTGAVAGTLLRNGTAIGTMNIAAGATAATFTFASAVTFAAGDLLKFTAPSPADATLAGLFYTFKGTR